MPPPTVWVLSLASSTASEMGLVVEDVVRFLRCAPLDRLARDHHPAGSEVDLLANLGHHVPATGRLFDEEDAQIARGASNRWPSAA